MRTAPSRASEIRKRVAMRARTRNEAEARGPLKKTVRNRRSESHNGKAGSKDEKGNSVPCRASALHRKASERAASKSRCKAMAPKARCRSKTKAARERTSNRWVHSR